MSSKRKTILRKTHIRDAISEAYGELTALGEELREWASIFEEKFPTKAETIGESADTLENVGEEPDTPDEIQNIEIEWPELQPRSRSKPLSRADRCTNAVIALDAVMTALDNLIDDDAHSLHAHATLAQSLRDELDNAKGEAEGVEFPSMFG